MIGMIIIVAHTFNMLADHIIIINFYDIEIWKYLWYFKNMIWNDRDDYFVAHTFNMLADHNLWS